MINVGRIDTERNSLDVKPEDLSHLRDAGNLLRWGYDRRQIPSVLEGRIQRVSLLFHPVELRGDARMYHG